MMLTSYLNNTYFTAAYLPFHPVVTCISQFFATYSLPIPPGHNLTVSNSYEEH